MQYPLYIDQFGASTKLIWEVVNDTVMGGQSSSRILNIKNHSIFQGNVSLQNGGGFASIRASLPYILHGEASGIRIRARGDGKTYDFRIRCRGQYARTAYRVSFTPAPNQMEEFFFEWSFFTPTFRGQILPNLPQPQPELIREIGFLIAQNQSGPFALELDWVRAEKP
ncbi:MAG: CIA30 family protein [Saprospiraceae bacterium]|nr:CIA30 family protein [Saprospiraceae bacterium]